MTRHLLSNTLFIILLIVISTRDLLCAQSVEEEILYGKVTVDQLFAEYPGWEIVRDTYRMDSTIISDIGESADSISVIVFLGTWCFDSEMQVPPFLKILETAGPELQVDLTLWAVDRNKQLGNKLTDTYRIERVPTFILKVDAEEIGRIVEFPETTLEGDLLKILKTSKEYKPVD